MMKNHRSTSVEPPPLIDVGVALDLLTRAVEERGPRFIYPPAPDPDRECVFRFDGATPSLLEQALRRTRLRADEPELLREHSVRELHREGRLSARLTLGAVVALDAAQRAEVRGLSWGDALAHARSAVARFAELLPDRAIDAAVARRAAT